MADLKKNDWSPERLAAEAEIKTVIYRYARGVDRRDWELVRSTYHPGAIDNHGPYHGSIEGFIEVMRARHQNIAQSLHAIANIIIEFASSDSALAESYFTSFQRLLPEAGDYRRGFMRGAPVDDEHDVENQCCGRYIDRFERRNGLWAIAQRTVAYDVYRGDLAPRGGGLNPNWVLGRRDREDAIEIARREMGLL